MLSDDTWRAIGARKQPRCRERPIGQLVRQQLQRLQRRQGPELKELQEWLRGSISPEFDEHCRLVSLQAGRLTVAVDDPGRLDMLRRSCLFLIRERLAGLARRIPVADVQWTVYREP
jgi:hypothetical protein